jgi:hypothetical protein
VLVDGPGGPEARPVELGPGDLVRVSVTAGLEGGESILLGGSRPAEEMERAAARGGKKSGPVGAGL